MTESFLVKHESASELLEHGARRGL